MDRGPHVYYQRDNPKLNENIYANKSDFCSDSAVVIHLEMLPYLFFARQPNSPQHVPHVCGQDPGVV